MTKASIALNRFGLGARGDQPIPADPVAWLTGQFAHYDPHPDAIAGAATSAAVSAELADYFRQQRALRLQQGGRPGMPPAAPAAVAPMPGAAPAGLQIGAQAVQPPGMTPPMLAAPAKPPRDDAMRQARQFAARTGREDYAGAVAARATQALITDTPFVERLVHFWANHFAVSADKLQVVGLAGTLEFEAIRPHVLGSFHDMLMAVEQHPAMLLYLDQAVSVGPNSPLGQRIAARGNRKVGLNENLARAMTGWTVAGIGQGPGARAAGTDGLPGDFVFAAPLHEPGDRVVMGKTYPAGGVEQARAVLADVAISPATAAHIATKLARHFAGDTPPAG
jgi:uncharacterized protein (DUF1800 family)